MVSEDRAGPKQNRAAKGSNSDYPNPSQSDDALQIHDHAGSWCNRRRRKQTAERNGVLALKPPSPPVAAGLHCNRFVCSHFTPRTFLYLFLLSWIYPLDSHITFLFVGSLFWFCIVQYRIIGIFGISGTAHSLFQDMCNIFLSCHVLFGNGNHHSAFRCLRVIVSVGKQRHCSVLRWQLVVFL